MKKLILLFLSLWTTISLAQYGAAKQADAEAVKSRTLLVVLEEPNPDVIKKLDQAEKDYYNSEIEKYNKLIQEVMPKYWKFSKVEFKSRKEVNELVKSKNTNYAYFQFSKFSSSYQMPAGVKTLMKIQKNDDVLIGGDYKETDVEVRLTEKNPLGPPVYGAYMPSPFPTAGEMVYGIKQVQLQLKYKSEGLKDGAINAMMKQNAKEMPKYTLLIDKARIDLKEDEIKKHYPFPFELVTKERIDEAFLKEENDKVAFVFIHRSSGSYNPNIVDTNEGKEMARTSADQSTGVSISTPEIDAMKKEINKGKIRKDDLKIIAKQIK